MIVNMQQQFSPSDFLRQIQTTQTPIRTNIAFIADKNLHIQKDLADLKYKLQSSHWTRKQSTPHDKPTPPPHFQYHSGNKPYPHTSHTIHFTPTPHAFTSTQNKKHTVEVPEQSDQNIHQLINDVTHYRQENTQLRQILGQKDHSAQQIINKLQKDIDTLKIEHSQIRNRQQRTIKEQQDIKKTDSLNTTCQKCIQLQLKIKGLQQQLQTETEQFWQGLKIKEEQISHLEQENNQLNKKIIQFKEKDLQNIEEYNELMQSYTHLNTDNETIMHEFAKASHKQMEQEQQLNDLVTRIEDINNRLNNYEGISKKGEHLDLDTLVTELDNKIRDLQTRLAEKTIQIQQLQSKLIQKDEHFHRLTDEYSEAIERMQHYEQSESIYKHKIEVLQREISKLITKQAIVNPVNEELVIKNQQLHNQMQLQSKKRQNLEFELNIKQKQIIHLQQILKNIEGEQNNLRDTLDQKDNTIEQLENQNDSLETKIKQMIYVEEANNHRENQFAQELTPSTLRIQLLEAERQDMRNKIYQYQSLIARMQSQDSSNTQQHAHHNLSMSKQNDPTIQQQITNLRRQLNLTRKRIEQLQHDLTKEQLSSERINREHERTIVNIQNDNINLINQNQQLASNLKNAEEFINTQTEREKALERHIDSMVVSHQQITNKLEQQQQQTRQELQHVEIERRHHVQDMNHLVENYNKTIDNLNETIAEMTTNQAVLKRNIQLLEQSLQTEIIAKRAEEAIWKTHLQKKQLKLRELSQQNDQLKAAAKDQEVRQDSGDNSSHISLTLTQSFKIGESLRLGTSTNGQKGQKTNEEQLSSLHKQIGQLQHNEYVLKEEITNLTTQLNDNKELAQHYTQITVQYNKLAHERIALFQRLAILEQSTQTVQKQNNHLQQQLNRTPNIQAIINDCNQKLAQMDSYIHNEEQLFRQQIQYLNKEKIEELKTYEQKLTHSLQRQLQNKHEIAFFKNKLQQAERYLTQLQNNRRKTPFEANVTDFLLSNQNTALKQQIWKLNHQIAQKDYQKNQLTQIIKSLQTKIQENNKHILIIQKQKINIELKYRQIAHNLEQNITTFNNKIIEFKNQISPTHSSPSILNKIRDLQQLVNRVTKQANYFKTKLKEAQDFIDRLQQPKNIVNQMIEHTKPEQEQTTINQIQIQNLKNDKLQLDQSLKEGYEQIKQYKQNSYTLQHQLSQTETQLKNALQNSRLAEMEVTEAMKRLKAATQEVIFLQNKLAQAQDYIFYLEKTNSQLQTTTIQQFDNDTYQNLEKQNHNIKQQLREKNIAISRFQQQETNFAIALQQKQQLIQHFQQNIEQSNRKIKELQYKITQINHKYQKQQAELITVRQRNILIEKISNIDREQLIEMQAQITTLSSNHELTQQKTTEAQQIVEKLQIEVDFFKNKLDEAQKYISQVQNQKINDSIFFQAKMEETERKLIQIERTKFTIEQQHKQFVRQNYKIIKEQIQQRTEIQQSLENTKFSLMKAQQIIRGFQADKQILQFKLKEIETEIDRLENDKQQCEERANYLQNIFIENINKIKQLQNQLQEAENYIQNIQHQKHTSQNTHTKTSHSVIDQSDISHSLKQQKEIFQQLIKDKEEVIRSLQTSLHKKDIKPSLYTNTQFFKGKLAQAEEYISQMQQQNNEITNAILYLQQSSMKLNEEIAKLNQKLIISDSDKELLIKQNIDMQNEITELVSKNQQLDRIITQLKLNTQRQIELAKNEVEVLKVQAQAELINNNKDTIIQQLQHQIIFINQDVERLSIEVNHLKQQLVQSQSKINQNNSITHSLNLSLTLKDNSIVQQQTQMQFFQQKLLQAEQYITNLQQQKQHLGLQIQSLTSNVTSLANQINHLNDKIVTSDRNSIDLLSQIQEKSYQNEALKKQLSNMVDSRSIEAIQQISNLKQVIIQMQRQLQYERESHKNDIDYLTSELNETQGLKQQIQMDKQIAEEHLAGLEILLQEIKKKASQVKLPTIAEEQPEETVEFFKNKLQQAEDYIAGLQNENNIVKLAIESLHKQVASLSVEVARLNDKLVLSANDNQLLGKQLNKLKEEDGRQMENNRQRVITMQQMIDRLQFELEQMGTNKSQQEQTLTHLRNEPIEGYKQEEHEQINYPLNNTLKPPTQAIQENTAFLEGKLQQAQNYILQLQEQKQNISNAFNVLNKQAERLRQQINQLKQKVITTDADNLLLTQAGQQMKRQNQQLKIKWQLKQREQLQWIEEATEYRRQQDAIVAQLHTEKTKLINENQNYQHIVKDYEHVQQDLENRENNMKHTQADLQNAIQILTRDKQNLQTQLQEVIRKTETNDNKSLQYSPYPKLQYPSNHINDLQNERLSLINQNEDLKNSVNMLISEIIHLKQHTDKLQQLNNNLKPEMDLLKNDNELMEADLSKLHSKLTYLQSLISIKDQQITELKNMNQICRNLVESHVDDAFVDVKDINNEIHKELNTVSQQKEEQTNLVQQMQAQISSLLQSIERRQEQNRQLKVENLNLQAELHQPLSNSQNASETRSIQQPILQQHQQTETERLQTQIARLTNNKNILEKQISRLQNQFTEMQSQITKKQTKIQSLSAILDMENTNKQNMYKQSQYDELAIENQKLSWKIRDLEQQLVYDDKERLQLIQQLETTEHKLTLMNKTEEQLQNQLQQLIQHEQILQHNEENYKQHINQLESNLQKQMKIQTEIRKVINLTNNFTPILDQETILNNLQTYPCLHQLINSVFYKLRLSSALTLQKQLKLQMVTLEVQSLRRIHSQQKSFRSSPSHQNIQHELLEYETLNKQLQQKLQTLTMDFNLQGEILRQYERQIDESKSQLEQESIDKVTRKQEPIDSSLSINTKDVVYLQLLTTCIDKIIDIEQAVEQIQKQIIQITPNQRINISQQSQDSPSGDSNLIGRLQELEDKLTQQGTHNKHKQSHKQIENDKILQKENVLQNESQQRSPNDLLREITGLNHAVEIYHAQSSRRRQHYRSTIEGMLLLSEELRQIYDQISLENGQSPITEVCQSMDELGKLIKNALQNVQEDQKSGEIQLNTGKDSIISGNYTQMLEVNRQKQGKPGFDELMRLPNSLGNYLQRNVQNIEIQTDETTEQYRNPTLTHEQIVKGIDERRRWYYETPTQLSDAVYNHLVGLILFVQGDQYFYDCIQSLFSVLYKIEQSFENALNKKNQVYRIHNEKMNKILNENPTEREEELLTAFEYLDTDKQQPKEVVTHSQQSCPQSDSVSPRQT